MKKVIAIIALIIIVAVAVFLALRPGDDYGQSGSLEDESNASIDDQSVPQAGDVVTEEIIDNNNQPSMTTKGDEIALKIIDAGTYPYYFIKIYAGVGFGFRVTLNGETVMKLDSTNARRRSNMTPGQAQTLLKDGRNEIGVEITDVAKESGYYQPSLGVYIVGNDRNALPDMFPANPNDPQPHIITSFNLTEKDIRPGNTTYVFTMKR